MKTCGLVWKYFLLFASCYLWSLQLDSLSLSHTNFLFCWTVCQFVVTSRVFFRRFNLESATLDVNDRNRNASFCNLVSYVHHLEHQEGKERTSLMLLGSWGKGALLRGQNVGVRTHMTSLGGKNPHNALLQHLLNSNDVLNLLTPPLSPAAIMFATSSLPLC